MKWGLHLCKQGPGEERCVVTGRMPAQHLQVFRLHRRPFWGFSPHTDEVKLARRSPGVDWLLNTKFHPIGAGVGVWGPKTVNFTKFKNVNGRQWQGQAMQGQQYILIKAKFGEAESLGTPSHAKFGPHWRVGGYGSPQDSKLGQNHSTSILAVFQPKGVIVYTSQVTHHRFNYSHQIGSWWVKGWV